MKNTLLTILIAIPLSLFSQNEANTLDENSINGNNPKENNDSYNAVLIPGIELPAANAGAEFEDEEEGKDGIEETSKIYMKVNLNNDVNSKKFIYDNFFIDPNIWEKSLQMVFSRQGNNLWSIETIIKDAKMSKVSINDQFTNSNIVLAQFSPEGKLTWITDIAGNRITTGDMTFNLHILYLDGRDQVLSISLGQINTDSVIQMSKDESSVSEYKHNGSKGNF